MKVFYSWQSDLPNKTNRGFIQKALENAVRVIRDDDSIQVEPVIDRDTSGVPGSPDIASTIFQKIEEAGAFVADVSIVNMGGVRPTPNPNVLIELGYAMKAISSQKIIMVLNTAFGQPEMLPFDLRMRRVITYNMPEESDDRSTERRNLEKKLEEGIRIIIADLDKPMPGEVIEPVPIEEKIDLISLLDRELNFKTERSRFQNSEVGVKLARQEVEKLRSILQAKAEDANSRSTQIQVSFEQKGNNHWVLFCRGISLSMAWSPSMYGNVLENSELHLSLWQGQLGYPAGYIHKPKELRNSRYTADLDIDKGIGWLDSGKKFFTSEQIAETWFLRMLDEVGKR
jgi:hypothetical protein